jgi:cytochrome c biogenesis protein CcmG, thiol:disulfide interchange protein DsbE
MSTDEVSTDEVSTAGESGTNQAPPAPAASWRGPRLVAIAIGIITIGLVILLATRKTANERSTVSPLIGQVAPEITGNDVLDGKRVELSSSLGRWTVLNFFGTWCPPCKREHPEFVAFSETNPDVQMISVINEDTQENVRQFFAKNGGNWPVLDVQRAAVDYGITGLPESYLIAPDGRIAYWFKGGVTQTRLQTALDSAKQSLRQPPVSSAVSVSGAGS